DNVIFAGKLIREIQDNFIKEQILPPIPEIVRAGLPWGTVNISLDFDGFVRRYELFQSTGKDNLYSIGVLAVAADKPDTVSANLIEDSGGIFWIGKTAIPKISSRNCLLNFYGPARTFDYFDFADVLDDSAFELPLEYDLDTFELLLEEDVFRDKIILIGPTADEFHDSHNIPLSSGRGMLMPGVEIHANFIEMTRNNDFLREPPYLLYLLCYLLLAILVFLLNISVKPTISLLINLLIMFGYFFAVYFVFLKQRLLFPVLEIPALLLTVYILGLIVQYIRTFKERKFIKQAFKQYLAPELVNELIKNPHKLEYGGTQRDISVLFSDIREFTQYTENHAVKDTVTILHDYLTAMVEVIHKNKGTLDKFVGDSIIAIFGDPVTLDNHAYWACKSAFEMRVKFNELREKWQKEKKDLLEMGIGINSGIATVGNLGSDQIFDYTAIGDTMNTGARIENLNKQYQTENKILISEKTYLLTKEQIIADFLDEVKLRGKTEKIKIYELKGIKNESEK
ncbi:MAG: adenylate/guanylate cyclase domain-containing protein, partial [Candidatus Cloacimonetes bacterium]|nr:adenylate/guanylate cyclase domain-containing protein [Candidatus Cloacimonadota bacterium]